ncbi:class I SAM-dependent methyltransferase [bacterium]|nr:class I SAM-dependent methyltransferase [bacterium]
MAAAEYKNFYEQAGRCYPEEEMVYRTLSGRLRLAFILGRIGDWKGRFLDIGCNAGTVLKRLRNPEKYGADLSLSVLRKLRRGNPEIPIVAADAQNLECFRAGIFMGILCSEVLEHLPDPGRTFLGIAGLLAPGGLALVTTPNYRGHRPEWVPVGVLARFGVVGVRKGLYFHTAFRPEELEGMAKSAGLTVLESGTLEKEIKVAAKPAVLLFWMPRWLNRKLLRSGRLDMLLQNGFDRITLAAYAFLKRLHVQEWLNRRIQEGVRSFILVQKPSQGKKIAGES